MKAYIVEAAKNAVFTSGLVIQSVPEGSFSVTVTGLASGTNYYFRVKVQSNVTNITDSSWTSPIGPVKTPSS